MASSGGDFATSAAPSPRPFGAPGQYDESDAGDPVQRKLIPALQYGATIGH